MIKAILACDEQGGVSKDGKMPWPHNSTDLKWFKQNTAGQVVVMGSTTWKAPDMPRPLPNRVNVVVTNNEFDNQGANIYISGDLCRNLLALEEEYPNLTIWVIGGPDIVKQTIDVIDVFYLSRIPGDYACDTFLSVEDIESKYKSTMEVDHEGVTFEIWEKK
jgi:dihydrofolate reductase